MITLPPKVIAQAKAQAIIQADIALPEYQCGISVCLIDGEYRLFKADAWTEPKENILSPPPGKPIATVDKDGHVFDERVIVYRDGSGRLFFIDYEGDVLYFEIDLDKGPVFDTFIPDAVFQLQCYSGIQGREIKNTIIGDIAQAVEIDGETWESIRARSFGYV